MPLSIRKLCQEFLYRIRWSTTHRHKMYSMIIYAQPILTHIHRPFFQLDVKYHRLIYQFVVYIYYTNFYRKLFIFINIFVYLITIFYITLYHISIYDLNIKYKPKHEKDIFIAPKISIILCEIPKGQTPIPIYHKLNKVY